MQEANTQSEFRSLYSSGGLPPTNGVPIGPHGLEPAAQAQATETLEDEPPVAGTPSPQQPHGPRAKPRDFLPHRGLYYTAIAGVIAGVFTSLLTIVVTLVFAGTFHTASQQIAVDTLTVKTALALAALELLTFTLSLLIGLVVGRIAVRRRLGFLAGALAGAVFSLITFLVGLTSGYPGNLAVKATTVTAGSLVISLLLLCLWIIGGGLVSLLGTWVATVRYPHYVRLAEQ